MRLDFENQSIGGAEAASLQACHSYSVQNNNPAQPSRIINPLYEQNSEEVIRNSEMASSEQPKNKPSQ